MQATGGQRFGGIQGACKNVRGVLKARALSSQMAWLKSTIFVVGKEILGLLLEAR